MVILGPDLYIALAAIQPEPSQSAIGIRYQVGLRGETLEIRRKDGSRVRFVQDRFKSRTKGLLFPELNALLLERMKQE